MIASAKAQSRPTHRGELGGSVLLNFFDLDNIRISGLSRSVSACDDDLIAFLEGERFLRDLFGGVK